MLTLTAFYYHPSLEVARAQWAVAKGGETTAGQKPNPTLSVTPAYNATTFMASPWIVTGSLDVPLETAGKRGYRKAQAAHLSEAARLKIAAAAWQVRSNLRGSLIDFASASRREELLAKQLAAQEKSLGLLEQRAQAGAISRSELTLPRIALEKTRLDSSDAQRQAAEARARAAEAIGVPIKSLDGVELAPGLLDRTANAKDLVDSELRRQALQSRADILSALAEYAASQSALQLEIAKQYPDVHLSPGYEFDQGDSKWSVGFTVELPVLNQNQGPIAEAKARRSEAAARFNELQSKVLAEIDRAVEVFRMSEKTLSNLKSLQSAQDQQRKSIEAQVKAGAADQLDLMNAQVEFGASELVRLDGQVKFQQAVGALEDALQRPLDFPKTTYESERSDAR
jgi:outer membrane protein TolC